eukprot:m51a1_g1763 putative ankyrin repeat-containing protein (789) ;mRNA; r:291588-295876
MADFQHDTVVIDLIEVKDVPAPAISDGLAVVVAQPKTKRKVKAGKSQTKFKTDTKIVLIMPKEIPEIVLDVTAGKKVVGLVRIPVASLQPYNREHNTQLPITALEGQTGDGQLIVRMYLFPKREDVRRPPKKYKTPLFRAIAEDDLFGLLVALDDRKIDVNAQDEDGWTALHHACDKWQNENWLLLLLRNPGANANCRNRDGNTVLHTFCQKFHNPNCREAFDQIIARHADVNARNNQGESALHKAVFNPRIRMMLVEMLLERGAMVNVSAQMGGTPLHYAVQLGRNDLVTILITNGADLTATDFKQRTPLQICKDEAVLRKMQDFQALGEYLDELGAGSLKQQFFQKQLFKYKLKGLSESALQKQQIDLPAGMRLRILSAFKEITDVDPTAHKEKPALGEKEQRIELENQISKGSWDIQEADIEFTKLLGTGTAGEVYKGLYKGNDVAIKILKMSSGREVKEFLQEFEIISSLKSKFVTKLYGAAINSDKLKMVMEYCAKGSLYDVLSKMQWEFGWPDFFTFTKDLLQGMVCLHNHTPQILHRDLKSLNLLVTDGWEVKLCDFGLSRFDAEDMATLCKLRGTFAYTAPEVYFGTKYTSKSDVFSVGIIMWEMVYRVIMQKYQRPYSEFPELKMDFQIIIQTATKNVRPTIPASTPAPLATLIRQMIITAMGSSHSTASRPTPVAAAAATRAASADAYDGSHAPASPAAARQLDLWVPGAAESTVQTQQSSTPPRYERLAPKHADDAVDEPCWPTQQSSTPPRYERLAPKHADDAVDEPCWPVLHERL